ncbi:MAG: secretin N-terminal domain-containing protein [Luteolibacter sp.]
MSIARRPISILALTALGSPLAVAQSPVENPALTPPTISNEAETGTVTDPNTKITEDITEPKLSGTALAGLYRKYTGRRVIVTSAASTAEFSFVQEANKNDPLTYAQAASLLRKAATVENFVFVPDATDPNLDILTLAGQGLKPSTRGLEVYNETSTLPEGDAVISYVMSLRYIKPDEAVRTFTQIVGQFGEYGTIAAVPNASAIVITDNTSLIRKLVQLKEEIDKPSSQVSTRFIKVQYADVTELATTLTTMLNPQKTGQQTAGFQRNQNFNQNQGGNNQGNQATVGSSEESPAQIVPDPRTNRIFAMGRPVDLMFIEGLIREFDTETDQKNFLRRKLRFLKVSEFLPIAEDALTRAFTGTGAAATGTSGQNNNQQQNQQTTTRNQTTSSSTSSSSTASSTGTTSAGITSLSDPNISTAPESRLVGRTLLVADNITNSIVVQGPPAGVEIIQRLLDQIDVKADQVMISCVFGQLTLTDGWSFGMDYAQALGTNHVAGRGGSGSASSIPLDGTAFDAGSIAATAGLGLYGKIGNNLNVYLNAKQSDSNFKVLSRPTIYTANNQKGTIVSGTQIAVPTSSYTSSSSTTATTNYEYKDVALKLEVIPLVNSQREVTMQIFLTSDDIGNDRQVGTGDSAYEIPDILNRQLVTTVTIPNNETIALGGLITETTTDSRSGIPILSRIPVVGPLFGSKSRDKERSELLVFIQPSIVSDTRTLDDAQVDMDRRYKTSGDTRRFADGPAPTQPAGTITSKGTAPAAYTPEATTPAKRKKSYTPNFRQ